MFSFKTINTNKSSFKGCCLLLLKGFSTLVIIWSMIKCDPVINETSFANLIDSVIPAASKPSLIIESLCFLRWLYVSTIHLVSKGFKSLNLMVTFTSPGEIPFDNCLLTISAYYVLNLFEMIFLLLDLALYPRAGTYW